MARVCIFSWKEIERWRMLTITSVWYQYTMLCSARWLGTDPVPRAAARSEEFWEKQAAYHAASRHWTPCLVPTRTQRQHFRGATFCPKQLCNFVLSPVNVAGNIVRFCQGKIRYVHQSNHLFTVLHVPRLIFLLSFHFTNITCDNL